MWYYVLATKHDSRLCIKCNEYWLYRASDILVDLDYKLRSAQKDEWDTGIDADGIVVVKYELNYQVKNFDPK